MSVYTVLERLGKIEKALNDVGILGEEDYIPKLSTNERLNKIEEDINKIKKVLGID